MHQNNCFLEVHETPQIPRKCLHGYDREQLRLLKHIMKLIALPKKKHSYKNLQCRRLLVTSLSRNYFQQQ